MVVSRRLVGSIRTTRVPVSLVIGSMVAVPLSFRVSGLSALVGKVWIASFPDGNLTDEQEFEWVFDRKFVRNTHRVRDATGAIVYRGETVYAWDPVAATVVWWYWSSTGGYVTGSMQETEEGWAFEGTNHAPPPQPERVKGLFRFQAADLWESVQYFHDGQGWQERFTMTFRPRLP